MTCQELRPLLHAFVDDELDLPTALAVSSHLPGCEGCRREAEALRALTRGLTGAAPYFRAPPALRARVGHAIRAERRPVRWNRAAAALSALAAALALTVGVAAILRAPLRPPRAEIALLVDSHVRSLEADHLLDVASTDQHTVKPWFAGKLDFSPPVVDLAADGFPLVGGRLDYLEGRKVAALVYRRDKHVINLFVWPDDRAATGAGAGQGFNLVRFERGGMVCWAVSDLNAAELQRFADLLEAR